MTNVSNLDAVVTGASAGIGASIAEALATQGRRVVTVQRRPPANLGPIGKGSIEFLEADLADSRAVRQVADDLTSRYQIGYFVNNAGANRPGGIETVSEEDLDVVWQLNVKTPVLLTQQILPAMRAQKFGRIVNISSRAVLGKTGRIAYASSKMGIIGFTRSLCLEVAAEGITVNAVAPGPVATELFDNGHPIGSVKREEVIRSIPVKRVGAPEDIARAVSFFLAPESGFITGQTLFVCGGVSISGSGGL